MGCCICVPQSEVYIVESWGRYAWNANGGFHMKNPISDSVAGTVTLRVQQLDLKIETKTSDNVFVVISVVVQYRVVPDRIFEAFYALSSPHQQIRAYVLNHIRAHIPSVPLDGVFTCKDDIAKSLKEDLEKEMNMFGFSVVQTLITDVEPDAKVKHAMNEINAAARFRAAASDKAEAEKIRVIKSAEAEAESKRLSGVGLAEQRKAVVMGLQSSIESFISGVNSVTPKEVMELLLMNQYFDTLKEVSVANKTTTVFLPTAADMNAFGNVSLLQGKNE